VVARLGLDELRERRLAEICDRWQVAKLELFGSALRPDFAPNSDVDLLVTFQEGADWGLLDHAALEEDLANLLGRPVDVVTRRSVERSANTARRDAILRSAVVLLTISHAPAAAERVGA
jgi:predicted nucleotidyltransferase